MTSPAFRLVARADQRAFLTLPWSVPLEEWPDDLVVDADRGIGRHVVRFVAFDDALYALKELPLRIAEREYDLLTKLEDEQVPIVSAAGIVERPGLEAVLITRYLEFALPYRLILGRRAPGVPESAMRAALAELLVRLHLVGFFWGDCSLSNALFRRDAGALAAYAVDAETGELHEKLSDGQRLHDLEIAEENLAGELFDLAAELERDVVDEPFEFAADVRSRYDDLWSELTRTEVFPAGDNVRLEERIRRLNELGYDVDEVELISTGSEVQLRLHSKVVEPDYHRRRLLNLTGLNAQENQARRLLNSITRHRARLEREGSPPVSDVAGAAHWLSDVFEPAIAAVPRELVGKRAPAEIFHEILEHRWFLSERAGRDVGMQAATSDYVEQVLTQASDERIPLL